MPTLKHLVIFIYITELIAFTILFVDRRRSISHTRDNAVLRLCAFMFVRILVKMVYFYVEYYVLPWHLNILFNSLMDTTYVISLFLSLDVVCSRLRMSFPRKQLYIIASILYVAGFAAISFLWVDRASNHLILIEEGTPQLLYNANETLFLVVALAAALSIVRRARGTDARKLAAAISATVIAYAIYVFFWDVSFTVPGVDALRHIKPFDGVLFFAGVLAIIIALYCPVVLELAVEEQRQRASGQLPIVDLGAFAESYRLTAREAEVLELLVQGKSSSQVAEDLVISVNTAKRHAYNIYRKIGVGSRWELLYKVNHSDEDTPLSTSENTRE